MDQLSDKTLAGIYAISKVCELPDFVKTASRQRDVTGVAGEHFGDPIAREYPLHTKEDTWLSWAYHSQFDGGNEKVAANIKRMAKFWKVDLPRFQVRKEASDTGIAINYFFEGEVHHTTNVTCAEDLNKIAADVRDNAHKYPYDMRSGVAKQVLSTSRKFNMELPFDTSQALHKMAAFGVGTVADAMSVITDRLNVCHTYGLTDQVSDLRTLIKQAASSDILPQPLLVKVARFADVVDRMSKQHKRYGHDFIRPEEALFSITLKDMEEVEKRAAKLSDGNYVRETQVRKPAVRKLVTSLTGEKVAYDELFEAVQKLPVAQAKLVSRIIG